jgi:hypothetical protein
MSVVLILSAAAAAQSGADRLTFGSAWHCEAVGLAESYSFDFSVDRAVKYSLPKRRISISKISGRIALPEQIWEATDKPEKNEFFNQSEADKDPYYVRSQYILRTGGFKTGAMFSWQSKKPEVGIDLVVYDWDRRKRGENYEARYGLSCLQKGATQ